MLRQGSSATLSILKGFRLGLDEIRQRVEESVPASSGPLTIGQIPMTPRGKRPLEQASSKAFALRAKHIGNEHILWALLNDEQGIAVQVLKLSDVNGGRVKEELEKIISHR